MKIILEPAESETYFYNALCNGLGYICSGYGLLYDYDNDDYIAARKALENPCIEDVLMQILRDGKTLSLVDEEGGEDKWTITLADVHERVSNTPTVHLMNMINENDDAETADVILQVVFMKEIIFG